jgi:THO complex subunit 5
VFILFILVNPHSSAYQDVPLHPLDQFTTLAPSESTTEDILSDEHQLMLHRLSFELAERQRLEARRKELMQSKENLLKQSRNKIVTLDSVRFQIENLMKTATDIQKKVDDLVTSIPPETSSTGTAPVT